MVGGEEEVAWEGSVFEEVWVAFASLIALGILFSRSFGYFSCVYIFQFFQLEGFICCLVFFFLTLAFG